MKTRHFFYLLATITLFGCSQPQTPTSPKDELGCGDKHAANKREKLCKKIVDNDTITKQYYFRYMDFWEKSHTPEREDADADSMQFYLEKLWSSREERMKGLDSITIHELYFFYVMKAFDWSNEWCQLNDKFASPVLIF